MYLSCFKTSLDVWDLFLDAAMGALTTEFWVEHNDVIILCAEVKTRISHLLLCGFSQTGPLLARRGGI